MQAAGVELREGRDVHRSAHERRRLTGDRRRDGRRRHRDRAGPADRRAVAAGRRCTRGGLRIPAGAARHTVAVLEPHAAFAVDRMPMVFDLGAGPVLAARGGRAAVRLERSGRAAGRGARRSTGRPTSGIERGSPASCRSRATSACAGSGPPRSTTRPTTCRSSGPAIRPDGSTIGGVTVAAAGGHGMMWGPGVARVAADLALRGATDADRRHRPRASTGSMPRAGAGWRPTRSRCRIRPSPATELGRGLHDR